MSTSTRQRRSTLRDQVQTTDGDIPHEKIIDAGPSLQKAEMYGIDDPRPASSKMMAMAGRVFIETIPQLLAVLGMLGLIFGGCCSNVSWCMHEQVTGWVHAKHRSQVYTLEAIVK